MREQRHKASVVQTGDEAPQVGHVARHIRSPDVRFRSRRDATCRFVTPFVTPGMPRRARTAGGPVITLEIQRDDGG
jgi:hypothetical protein